MLMTFFDQDHISIINILTTFDEIYLDEMWPSLLLRVDQVYFFFTLYYR